jgi:hypothetical protein
MSPADDQSTQSWRLCRSLCDGITLAVPNRGWPCRPLGAAARLGVTSYVGFSKARLASGLSEGRSWGSSGVIGGGAPPPGDR